MASHTQDDAFHEIQLNGKQLVFLVMAATVVSVAIFLCGVFVGRDVRAERSAMMQAAIAAQSPMADVLPSVPPSPSAPVAQIDTDPRIVAPPPTVGDSDARRSDDAQIAAEVLKPAAPRSEPAPATAASKPVAKVAERPQPVASSSAPARHPAPAEQTSVAPTSGDFAVQVAALNARSEADAIAKRLSAKGYSAFVQPPSGGTPAVYRVRVGTFKTRREAESVATRLQKEEQFKPWVTR